MTAKKEKREERHCFRAYHRLRRQRDFEAVAKEGKKINDEFLVINYRTRGDNKASRVGIITTRRLGKATERNRLRRMVKEAFRLTLPELRRGFDIVVMVREGAKAGDFHSIGASFGRLIKAAGLIKNESPQNNR